MRRVHKSILFCTLPVAAATILLAQGRATSGGRSVGAAAIVRNSGVGGRAFQVPRNYPAPLGLQPHAAGYTGINAGALRSGRGSRYGSSGYFLTPYYYPSLDYGSAPYGGGFDAPPPEDPNMAAGIEMQNQLGEQIQRLSDAVEQMRSGQQQSQGEALSAQAANQPPQAPVTFVLRSGQQLQVRNFAVMDKTIWDFTKPGVHKIPISSIDIAASAKATEANGGEFPSLD